MFLEERILWIVVLQNSSENHTEKSWTFSPFLCYSEMRFFGRISCAPVPRRRSAGFPALRRPLRRREDGESPDPAM